MYDVLKPFHLICYNLKHCFKSQIISNIELILVLNIDELTGQAVSKGLNQSGSGEVEGIHPQEPQVDDLKRSPINISTQTVMATA